MITKQLNNITWADLELLKEIGREEDDRIEYKAAFSGGADYLALGDKQRQDANVAIAKEVVAFLNGRGGDVLIGVKEASNSHPKIEDFSLVANADEVASRLAASLSALIEPAQFLVNLRVIKPDDGGTSGVIVIRAPASLRAPHRVTKDKECYVRRGSRSTPMPMDEIQDMVLGRTMRRDARLAILESSFEKMKHGRCSVYRLPELRLHTKIALISATDIQVSLEKNLLSSLNFSRGQYVIGQSVESNDVALRGMGGRWQPVPGGVEVAYHDKTGNGYLCGSKTVTRDGYFSAEFATNGAVFESTDGKNSVYAEWVIGFIMNYLECVSIIHQSDPSTFPAFLRAGIFCSGDIYIADSFDFGPYRCRFDDGFVEISNLEIQDVESLISLSSLIVRDVLAASRFDLRGAARLNLTQ